MNYIKKLQAEVEAGKANQAEILSAIIEFRSFLTSAKFTGLDSDGSRKDWISTGDVDRFLADLAGKCYAGVFDVVEIKEVQEAA